MPSLSATLGSSSSDSGGAGEAAGLGAACAVGSRGAGAGRDSSSDPRLTCVPLGTSGALTGSGTGVSSTSECVPVVQGSIARNSSKVRTRGLQHFQPGTISAIELHFSRLQHVWTYPSAPRGRRAGRGGRRTPRSRPCTSCRSPCVRTSSPCLLCIEMR
jgi:hypothetical protein